MVFVSNNIKSPGTDHLIYLMLHIQMFGLTAKKTQL